MRRRGQTPAHSYGPTAWQSNANATVDTGDAPGMAMFMTQMATQLGMEGEALEQALSALGAPAPPQSEECLTLTIRTPAQFQRDGLQTRTRDKLPVMVRHWPRSAAVYTLRHHTSSRVKPVAVLLLLRCGSTAVITRCIAAAATRTSAIV